MSLAIDIDKVTAVLLTDGWHQVKDASFAIDSFEYLWYQRGGDRDPMILLGGGDEPLIPARGFGFTTTDDDNLSGPLTSILAVKTSSDE
jgi:hypothetical protein